MVHHNNPEQTSYTPLRLTNTMLWPPEPCSVDGSDNRRVHACMYISYRHAFVFLMFCVYLNILVANATTDMCTKTYTSGAGRVCHYCSSGYYKSDDCVGDWEQARCRPCPNGTYQSTCNVATSCATCNAYCKNRHQVIARACNQSSDIVCMCKENFFWFLESSDPADGLCLKHSLCPRGSGLKAKGTYYNDTICTPCRPGVTFSSSDSLAACKPCTVCEHYNATCTTTSDATCRVKQPEISRESDAVIEGGNDPAEGMHPAILTVVILGSFAAIGFVVGIITRFVRRRCCDNKQLCTSASSAPSGVNSSAVSVNIEPQAQSSQEQTNMEHQAQSSQEQTSVKDQSVPEHYVTQGYTHASDGTSGRLNDGESAGKQVDVVETDALPTGPTLVLAEEEDDRTNEVSRVEIPTGTVPINREDKDLHSAQMVEECQRQQNKRPTYFTNEFELSSGSALHNTMETTAPGDNLNSQSDPSLPRRTGITLANGPPDETNVKARCHGDTFVAKGRAAGHGDEATKRTMTMSSGLQNQPEVQKLCAQHFNFLSDMSPNDFFLFYRTIAKHKQVDCWIDAAKQETSSVKEAQYQLMRKFYEVFPHTSHSEIIKALHDVNLNGYAEDYRESFDLQMAEYV